MSDPQYPSSDSARNERSPRFQMSRRTLLQAAVFGAAAIPAAAQAAQQATPVADPVPTPPVIPPASPETWNEPMVWRPGDWPGQQLVLNVVENENPGVTVGFGNPSAVLFSYNGGTPGPTIRMRGDETLLLRLRNMLGPNRGSTYVGPYPDPNALPDPAMAAQANARAEQLGNYRVDFCLGEHVNGVHSNHDTNIHSHGIHVRPGRNPDGTHSDNVILRVIDPGDLELREEQADSPACGWLRDHDHDGFLTADETTGFADYEFRIGNVQGRSRERRDLPPQPHPPGTHWYHPHCHGSTHNQVASGMAGFLIVEGDVDEAINRRLTGEPHPDPEERAGDYDYIERLMLIQRVFVRSTDPDAATKNLHAGGNAAPAVNGDQTPMIITMRPGAIERWRVLNGSVDGKGFNHFMVVKGQYDVEESSMPNGGEMTTLVKLDSASNTFVPASRAEVSADKQQLYQLAFDGVTLIDSSGEQATYTIRDLAQQNAGTENPLDGEISGKPNQAMLANFEACFKDATSVLNAFVRPNEIDLAPGNRADVFFQAPRLNADAAGNGSEVYTILSRGSVLHADDYQTSLQSNYTANMLAQAPEDIIVGYIIVSEGTDDAGNALPAIPEFDVMSLIDVLPEVPEYLQPVSDDDVRIKPAASETEADPDSRIADRAGKFRTRTITYSGWGAADFPLVTTEGDGETARNFKAFIERDQQDGGTLEFLRYAKIAGSNEYMLLAPNVRTMAITGSTSSDVIDDSDPLFPITANMGRKFDPMDSQRPLMLEETAEEWALYNYSISLWADTSQTPSALYGGHYPGQPLLRAEGQAKFAEQPADGKTWLLESKGVDHPFHMHQNPYWVMWIEIPDEQGNLINVLEEPRWQDVVWIPRNGGRVIFRSRFPDYVGAFVNHCHILLHEDHGMMQVVEITPFADQANYDPKDQVAGNDASSEEITSIYPRLDQAGAWLQSMRFVDSNHTTGQTFPGFVLGPPPGDA